MGRPNIFLISRHFCMYIYIYLYLYLYLYLSLSLYIYAPPRPPRPAPPGPAPPCRPALAADQWINKSFLYTLFMRGIALTTGVFGDLGVYIEGHSLGDPPSAKWGRQRSSIQCSLRRTKMEGDSRFFRRRRTKNTGHLRSKPLSSKNSLSFDLQRNIRSM